MFYGLLLGAALNVTPAPKESCLETKPHNKYVRPKAPQMRGYLKSPFEPASLSSHCASKDNSDRHLPPLAAENRAQRQNPRHNQPKKSLPHIATKPAKIQETRTPDFDEHFPKLGDGPKRQTRRSSYTPAVNHQTAQSKQQLSHLPQKKNTSPKQAAVSKGDKRHDPHTLAFQQELFPRWGGKINMDGLGLIRLENTCPIDNWIVILHALWNENKSFRDSLTSNHCAIYNAELENMFKQGRFDDIKLQFMMMNNINISRDTGKIDFFQNEFLISIKHLDCLFNNSQLSVCSSPKCAKKVKVMKSSEPICWANPDLSVAQTIMEWLGDESLSNCKHYVR